MFCKNCGRQLPDNADFCPGCGTKRSGGGNAYGDERSDADMKNLPDYTKGNERNRSGFAVDSDRKKFSLSGQNKFSLSGDSDRKKFSLSGQNKFSLSDKSRKDDGGGIVRLSAGKKPDAPPKEPTGFVNPLKNSGGTVFRSDYAGNEADRKTTADTAPAKPATHAGPEKAVRTDASPAAQPPVTPTNFTPTSQNMPSGSPEPGKTGSGFSRSAQETSPGNPPEGPGVGEAEPTGFVNPLKGSDQNIQWGSDGDRNTSEAGNIGKIDSHMGFAIAMTALCFCDCCISLPVDIIAIVFASRVSVHLQNGNFEQAKKCSDTALILCWVSLAIKVLIMFLFLLSDHINDITPDVVVEE